MDVRFVLPAPAVRYRVCALCGQAVAVTACGQPAPHLVGGLRWCQAPTLPRRAGK